VPSLVVITKPDSCQASAWDLSRVSSSSRPSSARTQISGRGSAASDAAVLVPRRRRRPETRCSCQAIRASRVGHRRCHRPWHDHCSGWGHHPRHLVGRPAAGHLPGLAVSGGGRRRRVHRLSSWSSPAPARRIAALVAATACFLIRMLGMHFSLAGTARGGGKASGFTGAGMTRCLRLDQRASRRGLAGGVQVLVKLRRPRMPWKQRPWEDEDCDRWPDDQR
jgi:hypothetical protein